MPNMLLGSIVSPTTITRRGNRDLPLLSMSKDKGLVINDIQNPSNNIQHTSKIVRYGQLVLGLHMDEGSIWVQNIIKEGTVSPAYDVLDVNLDVIDPAYMNYALHTNECMQFYSAAGVGSTTRRSKVPWESLKNMPLKVPDLKEQKASVDLIKYAEHIKQIIQQRLDTIGKIESGLFEEYVRGSDSIAIEKVADLTFGKTPLSHSDSSVRPLTYISGASDFGEVFTVGKKKVNSAERIVASNTVLISVRDPVGKVNITSQKCAIGRGVVGATAKDNMALPSYIYLALKKKQDVLNSLAYGIIKGIGPKEIKETTLDYIDISKQMILSESFYKLEKIRTILQKMILSTDTLYQKILHERFGCSVIA